MENGALRYTVTRCYVGVAGNPDGLRDGCRVGKVFCWEIHLGEGRDSKWQMTKK